MRTAVSLTVVALAVWACGGTDAGPSGTGGTSSQGGTATGGSGGASGAAAITGGSLATGGVSSEKGGGAGAPMQGGQASGGASSGGASGKGGANPTGGTNTAGARGGAGGGSSSGTLPAGKVNSCFGKACPLGECDNGLIAADVRCAEVYAGPVDENSMFCASGVAGAHCLTVATSTAVEYWVIACESGTPTTTLCPGGCGVVADMAKCL